MAPWRRPDSGVIDYSPIHISKMVLPTVYLGPPSETRTPRKDRCAKDHNAPSHISKMVPPTIHLGPPDLTKSRTFTLTFQLAV